MNKKGFEIAANMMVILILTIVIMGGGIFLLGKLHGVANKVQQQVDADTQNQIESRLLSSTDKVIVPINRKYTHINEPVTFAVGVRNVGSAEQWFHIYTTFVKAYKLGNEEEVSGTDTQLTAEQGYINKNWKFYKGTNQDESQALPNGEFKLAPNSVKVLPITIYPQGKICCESSSGTSKSTTKNVIYVFNVCVKAFNQQGSYGQDASNCGTLAGLDNTKFYDKKVNKLYVIVE